MTRFRAGGIDIVRPSCVACRKRNAVPGRHLCEECVRRVDEFCAPGPVVDEAVEAEYGPTERGGHRAAT